MWFEDRYAIPITTTTPDEAQIEDVLFLRRVLDRARIDYLLVRDDSERPILAIDRSDRKRLRAALAEGCSDEPFYSKAVGSKRRSTLVADGHLSPGKKDRVFRLFRPRVELTSGLRYGASNGVDIELWTYTDDEVIMPRPNALTRTTARRDEMRRTTVERYGQLWPTIEGMFDRHPGDIPFEIDLVFSWVDGSSTSFQAERAKLMQNYVVGEGDDSPARYRQIDELKYALRSVHMYAPWVRRIFVATDSPRPAWLTDDPRVTFVRSEEFFADPSALPTYNSMAVESQLHHIPGLSEHFLYSNDDMFFGRRVSPSLFFSGGGVGKFIECDVRIGLGRNHSSRSGFENSARMNRTLLQDRFGVTITRHLEHTPVPLRRSIMAEMEQEFADEFAATAASPFRAADNISVTNSFYHYYTLLTGRAVQQTTAKVAYVDTTVKTGLRRLDTILARRNLDLFCLNDGSTPEVDLELRTAKVTQFLERYYPIPAPWETGYPGRPDID
ncbi:stealth family protein [Rhodococcus sp. R1101]|uniref:stealth family protein n=1 Tax=Rhodococcus sp. R1101 TaxID=1170698 RepID=UPI0002F28C71|nr:stealth family protein [Rhodococcus sp. R1101]